MKKIYLVLIVLMVSFNLKAQENKSTEAKKGCSCHFQSINQAGLLQGEQQTSALLQTINGINYKQWFAGIGAGLDYYRYRGIPLFVDVRRNIFNKSKTPFVYADAGMHFSWVSNQQKIWWGENNRTRFNNGLYTDIGLGYSLGFKNKMAFLMSAGFSHKQVSEIKHTQIWCLIPPCPDNIETYKYGLNRLAVKLGFQF